jgi:hypothetical protein
MHQNKVDGWYVIFILSLIFGYFQFPFYIHTDVQSEIFRYYVLPINNMDGNLKDLPTDVMPLYFYAVFCLKTLLLLDTENAIILSRYLISLFTLIAYRKILLIVLAEERQRGHSQSINIIVYALFFYMLDHTVSWLMWVDQFRNATGNVFYLFFIFALFRKQLLVMSVFAVVAVLSHKQYIFLIPSTFLIYYISHHKITKNITFYFYLPLGVLILAGVMSELIVPVVNEHNWLSLRGRFSHDVNLGFYDALINKPGVILATSFYGFVLILFFALFNNLKNVLILRFSLIYFLIFFVLSKINVLGISFVEPARLYYTFSPFLCLLLAWSMKYVSWNIRILAVSAYIGYNFLLLNFSKETIQPTLTMLFTSIFDFVEHFHGGELDAFVKMLMIIIFCLGAIFVVKLLKELNTKSMLR